MGNSKYMKYKYSTSHSYYEVQLFSLFSILSEAELGFAEKVFFKE
ncbi:hypothetical protein [Dapis sp. BLCC M172]